MAVPTNFQSGVDRLRELGGATTTDVFGSVTYWTDDQLYQLMLEKTEYRVVNLRPVNQALTLFQWNLGRQYYVDIDGIELDGTLEVPTTIDPVKRTMVFTTPISDSICFNSAIYNMYECAAELWERKAAQRYDAIRTKAGANQLYLEEEYEHCVTLAKYYRSRIIRLHRIRKGW